MTLAKPTLWQDGQGFLGYSWTKLCGTEF